MNSTHILLLKGMVYFISFCSIYNMCVVYIIMYVAIQSVVCLTPQTTIHAYTATQKTVDGPSGKVTTSCDEIRCHVTCT